MNTTSNYSLPQFEGSDIFDFRDYNNAFNVIDGALKSISDGVNAIVSLYANEYDGTQEDKNIATIKALKDLHTIINNDIEAKLASVYKVKGSVNFADLPTSDLAIGDVYNIKDSFTTTSNFVEGEGISYGAGTNVVYTSEDKWDALGNFIDISGKAEKTTVDELSTKITSLESKTYAEIVGTTDDPITVADIANKGYGVYVLKGCVSSEFPNVLKVLMNGKNNNTTTAEVYGVSQVIGNTVTYIKIFFSNMFYICGLNGDNADWFEISLNALQTSLTDSYSQGGGTINSLGTVTTSQSITLPENPSEGKCVSYLFTVGADGLEITFNQTIKWSEVPEMIKGCTYEYHLRYINDSWCGGYVRYE